MIVAGTGHRPEKLLVPGTEPYSPEQAEVLRAFARTVLEAVQPRKVYSGLALGLDTALAQASDDLTIPFIGAVPFKGQESRWAADAQVEYRRLLSRAERVVVVSSGGYSGYKMQVRNRYMVDQCYVLLSLWDGTPGGTANCVEYAEEVGRETRQLWPFWQDFLRKRAAS